MCHNFISIKNNLIWTRMLTCWNDKWIFYNIFFIYLWHTECLPSEHLTLRHLSLIETSKFVIYYLMILRWSSFRLQGIYRERQKATLVILIYVPVLTTLVKIGVHNYKCWGHDLFVMPRALPFPLVVERTE